MGAVMTDEQQLSLIISLISKAWIQIGPFGGTCLPEDKLRPKPLVWRDDSSEQTFHTNLLTLCHNHNDSPSLRRICMAGLQDTLYICENRTGRHNPQTGRACILHCKCLAQARFRGAIVTCDSIFCTTSRSRCVSQKPSTKICMPHDCK